LSVVRVMSELISQVSCPTGISRDQIPVECGCDALHDEGSGKRGARLTDILPRLPSNSPTTFPFPRHSLSRPTRPSRSLHSPLSALRCYTTSLRCMGRWPRRSAGLRPKASSALSGFFPYVQTSAQAYHSWCRCSTSREGNPADGTVRCWSARPFSQGRTSPTAYRSLIFHSGRVRYDRIVPHGNEGLHARRGAGVLLAAGGASCVFRIRSNFDKYKSSGDVDTALTSRRGHIQERCHRQIVNEGGLLDRSQDLAVLVTISQVSEYYKSALTAANGTNTPSAGFFPAVRPDSCTYNPG
jgi:hypothetical protein